MFLAKLSKYARNLHMCVCRQEWVALGLQASAPSVVLTPEQRQRRSLYFQPTPATSAGATPQRTAAVTPVEVQAWIARELQAITLEQDVKLLCQVVLGCLAAVVQSFHNSGRRYFASRQLFKVWHHWLKLFVCWYIVQALESCWLKPCMQANQGKPLR